MPAADLILKNASVITADASRPGAGLVAVKGDMIMLVADNDTMESVKGPGTRIIDCEGKTLVPGFNDTHCHIFSFLRKLQSIDLTPPTVRSIDDIKAAIRRKAENTPRGRWITGTGYNDFYLAEKRHPNRRDIDEAAPDHPVVVSHHSLHVCVLNSRALTLAGINRESEEPPEGQIDREIESGEPSGLLFEMLGYIREKVMPPIPETELDEVIRLADRHYLSLGITSLQDATVVNDYGRWQKFRRFKDAGLLKSRVYMMFGTESLSRFLEEGLAFGSGDSHLRLGGVKITPAETAGEIYPPQPELNRMVFEAHRAGFQMAIHAIRYETVESAVTALEYALSRSPKADHRHRIEHCSECPSRLLERIKKLGIAVVTQPPFIYYSGERYLATVPADRQEWLYRIRSLLDSGMIVAGSSDSPIVPDNPLVGMHAAVNRLAETGQELLPEERISPERALEMYTLNAARASFEEDIKGSVTGGKLADLVLLNDNPAIVLPEQIKDIKVMMTIIGGKVVWEA